MIINQASIDGLFKSFYTKFNEAYDAAPCQWPLVSMQVPSEGRSVDYRWLGVQPSLREWLGDRAVRDISVSSYEIFNKDFESTVEVDRNDIGDDQIGAYGPMIQHLAWAAKQHSDILVFALLKAGFTTSCYDGQYFFDSDHPVGATTVSNCGSGSATPWYLLDLSRPIKPIILQIRKAPEFVALDRPDDENVFMRKKYLYGVDDRKNVGYGLWQLAYGSKAALDASAYAAARTAMMSFKNEEGVPLGINPTHLIVPPSLESAGRSLLKVPNDAAGAGNPWYGSADLIVVPWLA
ncbi:MAG: Mu-like prophage major head subunit gpT family protein [Desulfobacteraceae bacterium]|nr:Mu-like prophage major head subunit gpT family protein [Desulfobacteraceae bacterium]